MKLNPNSIGITEIVYPLDPAFETNYPAGTTPYQAPNLKIRLEPGKDYDQIYQLFAAAGVEGEYNRYREYKSSQAPYYTSRHIIHFTRRENIIKAITVLEQNGLIPDTDEGKRLLEYRERMCDVHNYENDVTTKKLLDWQLGKCNFSENLQELKNRLLLKLEKSLTALRKQSYYAPAEIKAREEFIEELQKFAQSSDDKLLIEKIEAAKVQFNAHPDDLAYVLLREGEDVIQKFHIDNMQVYRRDVYEKVLLAHEILPFVEGEDSAFYPRDCEGNGEEAAKLLYEAIFASDRYLGSPEAKYALAQIYQADLVPRGEGEVSGEVMAMFYYKEAAERGCCVTSALFQLGKMHMLGEGTANGQGDTAKAVSYFKRAIGERVCFQKSKPLGYVLRLVDRKDEVAIDYLREKLAYHKQQVLNNLAALVELIKKHGCQDFYKTAGDQADEDYNFSSADYRSSGIEHLQQIHFLADCIETNYDRPLYHGYVVAKEVLVEIYRELARVCQEAHIENDFDVIAEDCQERFAEQIKHEKPELEEQLREAIAADDEAKVAELFKQYGLTVATKFLGVYSTIFVAAEHGSAKVFFYLVGVGADVHELYYSDSDNLLTLVCGFNRSRSRPQIEQRRQQRLEIATYLIDQGIDVNAFEGKGFTAMHTAALYEFDAMIDLLAQRKAKIDARDSHGKSPLLLLLERLGNQAPLKTLQKLLDYGADIHADDGSGNTPLTAARSLSPEIQLLVARYETLEDQLAVVLQSVRGCIARYSVFGGGAGAEGQARSLAAEEREGRHDAPGHSDSDIFDEDSDNSADSANGSDDDNSDMPEEKDDAAFTSCGSDNDSDDSAEDDASTPHP